MKKLFALLLALIVGLFSAIPAGANVSVNSIDTPTETKVVEWAIAYGKRCRGYHGKIQPRSWTPVKKFVRRVALAPLSLLIGTASAEDFQVIRYDGYTFKQNKSSFNGADKLYERDRRMARNAEASRFLGNPAKASAEVFSNGIMAANKLLVKANASQLGGKFIFAAIYERKTKLDELKAHLNEVKALRAEDEKNEELYAEKRMLEKERQIIKSEIKVLNSAVKELREDATPDELALIDAQAIAAATLYREKKEKEPVGRQINMIAKPILKSYKMMHFMESVWTSSFAKQIKRVNDAAIKRMKLEYDEDATDDDRAKAKSELRKEFRALVVMVQEYLNSGKKIKLDARYAKVHNARQSQLTDVIGVTYGKTTDMIISLSHNIANVFVPAVQQFLDDDAEKAAKNVNELMELFVDIATKNGFVMETMAGKNGNSRIIRYKFWNANNSQLKVGKCIALSEYAYARAEEVGTAGMGSEEYERVLTNGSDMLKYWSYATTPGAPLMFNGEPLTVNDVLVVDSIDTLRKFKHVLVYKEDGTHELKDIAEIERTAFDGMLMFMVPIPSQQIRGGFAFKGFGVCCAYKDGTTIVDRIAEREGLDIPDQIKDIDGIMRNWRNYKVICTKDAWKWAGWKFEDGSKFKYSEYCARMNKLAEKYPTANQLYTARIADATEESKRRMTRQSTQQFLKANVDDIQKLTAKSIRKVSKLSTHSGVIRKMAGLDKPEEERTAFEHLVEVCPEILDHPYMRRAVEDMFNRQVAEAAVRPEVNGQYPYIAEDPVAFFKIILWGMNPNKMHLGYLEASQVNAPNTEEGKELYIVRYPNNYICGMVKKNHNDSIYDCVGNVMILPLDGGMLVIADGDTDGDEMCVVTDEAVVKMMKETRAMINPPIINFPHDKLDKAIIRGEDRARALSHAIVTANRYGPEVGKNSNLATKFFHNAAIAYYKWLATNDSKEKWKMQKSLENAILAHIAAIVAIDLAKTGKMPQWLETNLNAIKSYAGKKMPWNQRFCKDNKATPWFAADYWDDTTAPESKDTVDRIARFVIDTVNAEGYKAPVGNEFDLTRILCDKTGLLTKGSKGKLTQKEFRALEARNYRTKDTNSEGDDEFKLIEMLKSESKEDTISPSELIRFLWRNQASLVYVLQRDDSDKINNAMMQNAYFEFCHDILVNFGAYCGNAAFIAKPKDIQQKSNVWKFVTMALDENNGIGYKATKEEKESKKASFALFVVKVLAYDLYQMVCDKKGIEDRWIKPEESEYTDSPDYGPAESWNNSYEGYSDYECCDHYDSCEVE